MPKGRTENLRPPLTTEEARERGRRGGIKSGEVRRARKTLKEELLAILGDGDVQKNMALALISEAVEGNNSGSVTKAFETIRDTTGEKPVDKVMVSDVTPETMREVDDIINENL